MITTVFYSAEYRLQWKDTANNDVYVPCFDKDYESYAGAEAAIEQHKNLPIWTGVYNKPTHYRITKVSISSEIVKEFSEIIEND